MPDSDWWKQVVNDRDRPDNRSVELQLTKQYDNYMPKNRNAVALGSMGGRPGVPTECPRCGETQPTARQAWMHCRQSRSDAAKQVWDERKKPAKKSSSAREKVLTI